jgi:cysteine desulfurase
MAYFDWNATAPVLKEAREAWLDASDSGWANPSTPYRLGAQARLILEESRERIAALFMVHPSRVIFTSGATESNNAILREFARKSASNEEVWISAVEHPSVLAAAQAYWKGSRVLEIPVLPDGRVDLDWMEGRLKCSRPRLVCLMAVNNETGVIQPWQAALTLCRGFGVPFHCDAVQWMGKLGAVTEPWEDCAGVAVSGHKFGGEKGTGLLVLGSELRGLTVQAGGVQEMDSRAGTENVPGAVALATALQHRMEQGPQDSLQIARDTFEKDLKREWPGVIVHGQAASRVWNTCSVALPKYRAERWIALLDRKGFQVSSGSACSSGKEGPSHVLAAMGVDAEATRRTIRISGGWETPTADWRSLFDAIVEAREELDESPSDSGPGKVIQI